MVASGLEPIGAISGGIFKEVELEQLEQETEE